MRQSGGAGHRGRNPYHHCLCALSYQPAFTLRSSRRVGKNSTTNPSPFILLRFLFFFFDPCHSLPCKLGQYPSRCTLQTFARLAWLHRFFFLWNICCSSSRDVLCCSCPLCFDLVSCTPLGIGHVLQDSPGGLRVLFNAIATPLMLSMTSMIPRKVCLAVSHKARVPSTTPGILVSTSSSSKSSKPPVTASSFFI